MNKNKLLIFTGAGFSADSGIPTFRRNTGLWNNHRIVDVCNINTWHKNYNLVHNFYDELRHDIKETLPHEGFEILKNLEKEYNVTHFTTNIDDLYEKSGITCHHIHGELKHMVCTKCGYISDIGYNSLNDAILNNMIQHKDMCHYNNFINNHEHIYKPGITFYNEGYDIYPNFNLLKQYIKQIDHNTTVLIIGSSLEVIPLDYWLRHTRCHKYNINPDVNAGYNKDYKHWVNIKKKSIEGLHVFMEILKEYNK